jgi:cobalt-zinc-cadmium efflux system outer membrane protein
MMKTALGACILALVLAGCVVYRPKPVEPSRIEAQFRARSLSDPRLGDYIRGELGTPAAAWPPRSWDLRMLTLAAFFYQPELDVARGAMLKAGAAIETASERPNPALSLTPVFSTNPPAGISPWLPGIDLDFPIETAGKRGDRMAKARAAAEAARLTFEETGWQVYSHVRSALLQHVLAQQKLAALKAEEDAWREVVKLLQQRLEAGQISAIAVNSNRIQLGLTKLAVRTAEGTLAESLAALAQAIGVPADAFHNTDLIWPGLAHPPSVGSDWPARLQRLGLHSRLDLHRSLAEYAVAEAALKLEVARQFPDIRLGPGYTYDQGQNEYSLGLTIVLPILNRNRGRIAEAEAERKIAADRFLALQAKVIGQISEALARYRAAMNVLKEARQSLAIQKQLLDRTEREFQAGQKDRLDLAASRVQWAVANQTAEDVLAGTLRALGLLEDSIQRPLSTPSVPPLPMASPRRQADEGAER